MKYSDALAQSFGDIPLTECAPDLAEGVFVLDDDVCERCGHPDDEDGHCICDIIFDFEDFKPASERDTCDA